jgi:hypothetical protein
MSTHTDYEVQQLLRHCIENDLKKTQLFKAIESVQNDGNKNYFSILKVLLEKNVFSKHKVFTAMTYFSVKDELVLGTAVAQSFTKYYNLLNDEYSGNTHVSRKRRVMTNLLCLLVSLVLSYHKRTSNKYLTLQSDGKYAPSGKKISEIVNHNEFFTFTIDINCLSEMTIDRHNVKSFPTTYIYTEKKKFKCHV